VPQLHKKKRGIAAATEHKAPRRAKHAAGLFTIGKVAIEMAWKKEWQRERWPSFILTLAR
jgi:hypothetical protein